MKIIMCCFSKTLIFLFMIHSIVFFVFDKMWHECIGTNTAKSKSNKKKRKLPEDMEVEEPKKKKAKHHGSLAQFNESAQKNQPTKSTMKKQSTLGLGLSVSFLYFIFFSFFIFKIKSNVAILFVCVCVFVRLTYDYRII